MVMPLTPRGVLICSILNPLTPRGGGKGALSLGKERKWRYTTVQPLRDRLPTVCGTRWLI